MKPKSKAIFFSVSIALIISFHNCKSAQEKAIENAATNVCPELGRLDEKNIDPKADSWDFEFIDKI